MERWKRHPIWDVEVSTQGRVRRNGRVKKLTVKKSIGGDYHVTSVGGRGVPIKRVCRLVLETFKGLPKEGEETRHLDGNSLNDHVDNLKWGTRPEQIRDQKRHGTFSPPPVLKGRKNPSFRHSELDYKRAIRMYRNGASLRRVARLTGISRTQISRRLRAIEVKL